MTSTTSMPLHTNMPPHWKTKITIYSVAQKFGTIIFVRLNFTKY